MVLVLCGTKADITTTFHDDHALAAYTIFARAKRTGLSSVSNLKLW